MSTALLQYVADCFQGKLEGMHCLGAVSGVETTSRGGTATFGSRGAVMSVVRALGVLVCEGRLQGPPRGYKEGPHCAAPLQPFTNDHVCEKDNYLCARYIVLVRDIAERLSVGSTLSVEVSMCADCPCGLARATCNKSANSMSLIASASATITQWQHPSDVLLEYWSISVEPSKNSETMNAQGLYQAVRSRLHFSQVAAWWSRSNGTRPNYVTTRIITNGDENLRKFRDTPIEHTFPLAAIGDGNSIKVTVWALPRMEEVPTLLCPLHPTKENEDAARALTPTKNGPLTTSSPHAVENLVLPVLVDDRLQTACDKPGKHHCHCEDEEASPPPTTMMMIRPTGERKRRRSLPCGPPGHETSASTNPYPQIHLAPVRESIVPTTGHQESTLYTLRHGNVNNNNNNETTSNGNNEVYESHSYLSTGSLERRFRKQVSLEESPKCHEDETEPDSVEGRGPEPETEDTGNDEKRYKPSNETRSIVPGTMARERMTIKRGSSGTSSSTAINGLFGGINETATRQDSDKAPSNVRLSVACDVHRNYSKIAGTSGGPSTVTPSVTPTNRSNDLTALMSKLSFPKDQRIQEENNPRIVAIPDWFEDGTASTSPISEPPVHRPEEPKSNDLRLRNCSLELSQREFNEVLAVLRARTPITRRRAPPRSVRRRDRLPEDGRATDREATAPCPVHREKTRVDNRLIGVFGCECDRTSNGLDPTGSRSVREEVVTDKPADALLGAILRTSERTGPADASNGARPRKSTQNATTGNPTRDNQVATNVHAQRNEQHERYLPNVLNKRLSRFKQLFQKEFDRGDSRDNGHSEQRGSHGNASACSPGKSQATPIQSNGHVVSLTQTNGHANLARCRRNDQIESPEDETIERGIPSASEQEQFRRSFENAASMVFHSRTGLPLTSSPAPLRRGHCCFDYDSTLNTVSSKRSALFELNTPPSPGAVSLEETDREVEIPEEGDEAPKRQSTTRIRPQSHSLLGSFEESALNGRLEPVSTVHGFTAELGASGSFCPKHRKLPVTVFFYTLGDNDKVSTPYLAHINLGKKGYQVPRSGTIQVTLLNPLGTVVKMFVVLYDLSDMPPRSHTFLRQRTLRDKTLRYLVHLRFMSGKSGRIYLHTDIRMIICRKSDVDTASDFGSEPPKELRSYTHGPTNPKFSPRC